MNSFGVFVKLRRSTVSDREGRINYKVCYGCVTHTIRTGYLLFPNEWDSRTGEVVILPGMDRKRRQYLLSIRTAIRKDVSRLEDIIYDMNHCEGKGNPDEIMRCLLIEEPKAPGLFAFTSELIERMRRAGRARTAERYSTVINSFKRFRNNVDLPIVAMDVAMMLDYEDFLRNSGVCPNSSSFYMRGLRAIYNRAVDQELSPQRNPFRRVYTGIARTVKRGLPADVISRIRDIDLSSAPAAELARDVFMFSFYTRGMSFVDIAYLRKSDLVDRVLSYGRRKTGQRLRIKWEKEMQDIVDRHSDAGSPFLLPVIRDPHGDLHRQYKTAAHNINHHLKKIGEMLGLDVPLTCYVARHAWASIANAEHVPISVISEAMGHNSEMTTRIYLSSFDTSEVDNANKRILRSLNKE